MNLTEFNQLKKDHEQARINEARASDSLNRVLSELKSKFDCKSIAEAEKLHQNLTKEAESYNTKYEKALKRFQEEFGDRLGEDNG